MIHLTGSVSIQISFEQQYILFFEYLWLYPIIEANLKLPPEIVDLVKNGDKKYKLSTEFKRQNMTNKTEKAEG